MSDESVLDLLAGLASAQPDTAWREFLRRYAALVQQVVRRFESDPQRTKECFEHVCQALSDHQFRRVLSYQPTGPARFRTWLMAVTANLCIDWRRRKRGRFRPPRAVAQLPEIDQLVYRNIYVYGMPRGDCLHALEGRYPGIDEQRLSEINAQLFTQLTPQQRWQLGARRTNGPRADTMSLDLADESLQPEDASAGPDVLAEAEETRERLAAALGQLPAQDRLLLRLRYEQNLTLAEVARLTGLADPFRARRQIESALATLAEILTSPTDHSGRKKP